MYLVMKRFMLDDVPVALFSDEKLAQNKAKSLAAKASYATDKDEDIAQIDIGSELVAAMVVEFDAKGKPVKSDIYPVGGLAKRAEIRKTHISRIRRIKHRYYHFYHREYFLGSWYFYAWHLGPSKYFNYHTFGVRILGHVFFLELD